MSCPFCYIPFKDTNPGNLEDWKTIIDKISIYNPDIVTFGGGDPFKYKDFMELLKYCKKYPFQVHIDSNLIGLHHQQISKMTSLVDIIGIPLDGDRDHHDQIRNYKGHYELILKKLNLLSKAGIPVKINTVWFEEYEEQMFDIVEIINQYPCIKQWFIYEYWHFEGVNDKKENYSSDINRLLSCLMSVSKISDIHFCSVRERSPAYIFVSSSGNLYTVGDDPHTYVELGNILDSDSDIILSTLHNKKAIKERTEIKQYSSHS